MSQFRQLFTEGFRFFFLAAGIFGFVVIALWTVSLAMPNAPLVLPGDMSISAWHSHEMIFGYGTAALGGFFLTAVPNWTKGKMAPASFVTLLAVIWFAGRVAMFFAGVLNPYVLAAIDLLFIPVMGANIAHQLMRNPKPANLMFLVLLALIWFGNLRVHLDWMGFSWGDAYAGLRAGMMGICAMIAILGGRVTPAFTRNAMRKLGIESNLPVSRKPFEIAGAASAVLLPIVILLSAPDMLVGFVAIIAGIAQMLRLSGWRSDWTRHNPIIWSLHLAYGMLALGYFLYGLSRTGLGSEVGALHVLAIGAVGGMTLAVMSRASLGHTGRELIATPGVSVAYAILPFSALLRWIGSQLGGELAQMAILGSGVLWCVSLSLFVRMVWPVVSRPRVARA
ncbi:MULTISPECIES: NnrS family protein [Halocynthiibacter]|uniref:NnrS family protein n=1 Tax=Halocynthiibacter halioticoli TaxID=2986804 RepID=A0AAE3IWE4_9RHOB|nr:MULTISPECIES: NnrS family protein [Halocynthiibacter]MCV6823375.1 NnrS family protein [Halocynthiibacter halioticoli]MCW4056376.1 NnrS family protein [Halocynthiibacter sp. SDUM655004]